MTPSQLSVRHPIFIASLVILMLALGSIALLKLPIDLYPDVNFPTVLVSTTYPGAGPQEVETSVSKIIEDELSSISGLQKVSSQNREGQSIVTAEFDLKSDLNYAEQQVRAKVTNAMRMLPEDVNAPVIRRISPSDAPIMSIALQAELSDGELFDLAKERISPQIEQVPQVGQVDLLGGRKREIHVVLDRDKLIRSDISATTVVNALKSAGRNIPVGKTNAGATEYTYRSIAEYKNLTEIEQTSLRNASVSYPVTIGTLGTVQNSLQDEKTRGRFNGKKALVFNIFRQSGANSVKVADEVKKKIEKLNEDYKKEGKKIFLKVTNDQSWRIRNNVKDVYESIGFGILLTVIVVYLFLGSLKSTLITGFALPNSLLGACIFMSIFGFSINIMSLLAMSLVVGLLVDDAIVVRENIFRKLEQGMSAKTAAILGTNEVTLAVIATTLTILAVFGPIGNLEGIVGQFFKQFGLTVCFAMIVSLFDGLFVAPALSAYMAGSIANHKNTPKNFILFWNKRILDKFDSFQSNLEKKYTSLLVKTTSKPWVTLLISLLIFIFSIYIARFVPFTFLPPQDNGEFFVQFELPVGSSLDATDKIAYQLESELTKNPEVADLLTTVGTGQGESNKGNIFVKLVPSKSRNKNTTKMKDAIKNQLKSFAEYKIIVTDQSSSSGQRAFNLNIVGQDMDLLLPYAQKVLNKVNTHSSLQQADISYRTGKPEFQIAIKPEVAKLAGVTAAGIGQELRTQVEGQTPAIYRENGIDYDIRVRLKDDQRDLKTQFYQMQVPNIASHLIPLRNVALLNEAKGPTTILRENRSRYVQISADLLPGKKGIGGAIKDFNSYFSNELKPPPGISFAFVGEAERFKELMVNMLVSLGLGFMFIYLVLASLYGSFITPFTIMLVIPLAACGAFLALFITRSSFDLFSMIGCVMLMGLATKNSILLVDYALEKIRMGNQIIPSLIEAGGTRLRPILMTSLALIAGMIPVAVGLNEASKQRTSLGIVVIGGTISSTLLTLVVIPAAFIYFERLQNIILKYYYKFFGRDDTVI